MSSCWLFRELQSRRKRKIMQQLLLCGSLREVTAEDNVNEKRNTNNIDAMLVP